MELEAGAGHERPGADPFDPAEPGPVQPAELAVEPVVGPAAPPVIAATQRVPGVGETISGALDLALASSRSIRRASIYIGLLTLALAGPAVVVLLAVIRELGGLDAAVEVFTGQQTFVPSWVTDAFSWLAISVGLASLAVIVVIFEAQILAMAIIGGVATGRPIGIRSALRLSRRAFWVVAGAAFLVGILERIVAMVTEAIAIDVTPSIGVTVTAVIVAGALVTMPFGYYQAGIILGEVGAIEALKRSTWIAGARWRLAILVASTGVILSFVETFALGAGLDLVVRIGQATGLGLDGSLPAAILTGVVVLGCVVAIGSLVVTIAALVAAPQVFVFLRMTGYSGGLDRARPPVDGSGRPTRLVTRPMLAVIVLTALAAIAGLATLWS